MKNIIFSLVSEKKGSTYGGVKLIYNVRLVRSFYLGGKLRKLWTLKQITIVFWRPSKKAWGYTKDRTNPAYLPPKYWGRKNSWLTALWTTLQKDFDNYNLDVFTKVRTKKLLMNNEEIIKPLLNPAKDYLVLKSNTFLFSFLFNN